MRASAMRVVMGAVCVSLGTLRPSVRAGEKATIKAWPLVYHAVDRDAGTEQLEIAWPLIDISANPRPDGWSLIRLLSDRRNPVTDERRTSALFSTAGIGKGKDRWRFWTFPLLWFGRAPGSSHNVVLPIYAGLKDTRSSTRAVFPLLYSKTSSRGRDRGYFFLVWQGERTWDGGGGVDWKREYLNIFPLYWSYTRERDGIRTERLNTLFPLYRVYDADGDSSTRKWKRWRRGAFYLVWWGGAEVTERPARRTTRKEGFRVWPLLARQTRTVHDPGKGERDSSLWRLLGPIGKKSLRKARDTAGVKVAEKRSNRLAPVYFSGRNEEDGEIKSEHVVLFPLWWDVQKGSTRIQALVPAGARIRDDDFTALNILGPVFTRLRHEKKDYTRYDVCFPMLMLKKGKTESGFRCFPLVSREWRKGERQRTWLAWPLVRSEETIGRVRDRWFDIFAPGLGPKVKAQGSGQLEERAFPFWYRKRTAGRRSVAVHPFVERAWSRSGPSDQRNRAYLEGLYATSERTEPYWRSDGALYGIWEYGRGETDMTWRLFPLAERWDRTGYLDGSDTLYRLRGSRWAAFLYTRRQRTATAAADGQLKRAWDARRVPFVFDLNKSANAEGTERRETGKIRILPVPLTDLELFSREKHSTGEGKLSVLDPLWTRDSTAQGEVTTKSLGGFLWRGERDACGFLSHSFLYRVFRRETNSRGSSWEWMPFFYGEGNVRGDRRIGLLGGLLGYENVAGKKRLRFCFLPVASWGKGVEPLSEEATRTAAQRHLDYGLRYLDSRRPERALVELALAEPAFGQDPSPFERLGDAYGGALWRNVPRDLLEETAKQIAYFSSTYPVRYQSRLAGTFDLRDEFRKRALAAYDKTRNLGGDSALLRRKTLALLARRPNSRDSTPRKRLQAEWEQARNDFPDDFSLQLDDFDRVAAWRRQDEKRDQGETLLANLKTQFPNSATLVMRSLYGNRRGRFRRGGSRRELDDGELDDAIRAARLPADEPPYIRLPRDRGRASAPPDARGACLAAARNELRRRVDSALAEKAYPRAIRALRRLRELSALHREGANNVSLNWLFRRLRQAYVDAGRAAELIPVFENELRKPMSAPRRERWAREKRTLERDASYITSWRVKAPLRGDWTDEEMPLPNPRWTTLEGDFFQTHVDLRRQITPSAGVAAKCVTELESGRARDAVLLLGFDEAVTVELNGRTVFEGTCRIASLDEFPIPVRLERGRNRLVLRIANKRLAWGFHARFADKTGQPLPDLKEVPIRETAATPDRSGDQSRHPVSPAPGDAKLDRPLAGNPLRE